MTRLVRGLTVLMLTVAAGVPAASAQEPRFHMSAALTYDDSRDTRLVDRSCDPAPLLNLFGCQPGTDGAPIGAPGDFGSSAGFDLAGGLRTLSFLRVEVGISHRPGFGFGGNATFLNAGDQQPVAADLTQTALLVRAVVDLAPLVGVRIGPVEPFVSIGAGGSRARVGEVRYDFPALAAQPATTITPGGVQWSGAWDAGVGAAVRVARRLLVEGGYRYSDFGRVQSGDGAIEVVRGDRVSIIDDVAGSRAMVRSHGAFIGLRQEF